jgi:hypothetical protein
VKATFENTTDAPVAVLGIIVLPKKTLVLEGRLINHVAVMRLVKDGKLIKQEG